MLLISRKEMVFPLDIEPIFAINLFFCWIYRVRQKAVEYKPYKPPLSNIHIREDGAGGIDIYEIVVLPDGSWYMSFYNGISIKGDGSTIIFNHK